jgi:hypothetical protein
MVVGHVLQSFAESEGVGISHYACELDYLKRKKHEGVQKQSEPMTVLLEIIKSEARLLISGGAKHLSIVLLEE